MAENQPVTGSENRMTQTLQTFSARLRDFISRAAPGSGHAFNSLALKLFGLQFDANVPYRLFCAARRLSPATVEHWTRIPALPAAAFKNHEVTCLAPAARTRVFHSSGTTQHRPGRHFHSGESLAIYEASLLTWFQARVWHAGSSGRALCLTPTPEQAPHSSLAYMFGAIQSALLPRSVAFAGQLAADGAWEVDPVAAEQILQAAVAAQTPLAVLGTAFSFVHWLDELAERGDCHTLPAGSCVVETGGYKGRSRSLPQAELHALITEQLGVPAAGIVCEYGMSELSSQAYDTAGAAHEPRAFHFPPWARAQVISPETGAPVGEGETGLLRVLDLANVFSVAAIQTEDLAVRRGDGFELLGRAALAEPRGCSLLAVA